MYKTSLSHINGCAKNKFSAFRLDPLNRKYNKLIDVPLSDKKMLYRNSIVNQGADYEESFIYSLKGNKCRVSMYFLSVRVGPSRPLRSYSVRYHTCKVNVNDKKMDAALGVLPLTSCRQGSGIVINDLGRLQKLEVEIKTLSKDLSPLITEKVDQNKWPMLTYNNEISNLIVLRQRYLALLSRIYGLRSVQVKERIQAWLSKIDLRVFAIETVYRSKANGTPGVDNVILDRRNLLTFLKFLTIRELKNYKSDPIRRVYTVKGSSESRPFGIATIKDRIVQTLFVQILEPIIDVHADKHSYGFREGRKAHQAIGVLCKKLFVKPRGQQRTYSKPRYFNPTKYVLNINVKRLFSNVSHAWLLDNYPFPIKYTFILKQWLQSTVSSQGKSEEVLCGVLQSSVIGSSLANFILNGLEKCIKPRQITAYRYEKWLYLKPKGFAYKKRQSNVRKSISNFVVRYTDYFILITNDKVGSEHLWKLVKRFLSARGLEINFHKSNRVVWKNRSKFNYLGFTFHFITSPFSSRIAEQPLSKRMNQIKGGVYVYPSDESTSKLRTVVKINTSRKETNKSPYRLIDILNPIIREWGNYFCLGTKKIFSRLDHFIWFRT